MLLGWEQPRLPLVLEPLAFAPDVGHMAVVQQPVQYGRGNDSVPQEVSPLAKAPVGSEDYGASFVAGGHQSKEGGGRLPVKSQMPNSS